MLIDPIVFEEWKEINFYDIKTDMYKISNFGNVYSNIINRLICPAISNGYYTVQLSLNRNAHERKTFYIHRLVAMAFIPNPNPEILVEVNHKNKIRSDNFVLNLEWVTKQENINHELQNLDLNPIQKESSNSWGNGYSTYGENNGMSKFTENEVRNMLKALEDGHSYKEALSIAGVDITTNNLYNISHIARGHRWKYLQKEYNIPKIIPKS